MTANVNGEYLKINFTNQPNAESNNVPLNKLLPFAKSQLFTAKIKNSKLLTNGPDVKTTYEVELDRTGIDYDFTPGDAIGILPNNNLDEVIAIIEHLDLLDYINKTYNLSIIEGSIAKKKSIPSHIPLSGSLKDLFVKHLDIRSPPKKLFLKLLAQYTTNEEEKNELLELSDPKRKLSDKEKYSEFIANEGASLLSILRKFPSCKPPIGRLLEHLPSLKPRYYSLASSPLELNSLRFAFSVIEFQSCDVSFKGVCTGYLEKIIQNLIANDYKEKIEFYFRTGSNFLDFEPLDNQNPLILIGPGTGVAPFIGLLQHRFLQQEKCDFGETILFFGCRYTNRDFLYKTQLNEYLNLSSGVLDHLFTAFSRDTNRKVYVQDKIREQGRKVADLIVNQRANLRLCGDAKNLLKVVDEILVDVLVEFAGLDPGEAIDLIVDMKNTKRYQLDIWL